MMTVTSEYLDENPDTVLETAAQGPICITEAGEKAYVLMSIDDYKQLIGEEALSALLSRHANSGSVTNR